MESSGYDFSEDEIRDQLEKFGFHHIPDDKLKEFKKDLDVLIRSERAKLAEEAIQNMSYTSGSTMSPDARSTAPHYPYRPEPQQAAPVAPSDGVTIHVTGVDPRMRRMHASATYHEPAERISRSAPTSPTRSVYSQADEGREERRTIKRKVLRKVNGESVIDESFIDSESDDSLIFREPRVRPAPLSDAGNRQQTFKRPHTAPAQPFRVSVEVPQVKSVIYPMAQPPHEKNLRRCDPVSRFHEFKDYWEHRQIPGEKSHKSLRWTVRENMLHYDPVVKKSQKTQVPNTYVVPTEKKRMALRWQVRSQLAEGRMPGSGYVST